MESNIYRKVGIIAGVALVTLILILLLSKVFIYLTICGLTATLVYTRYTLKLPFKIEPYLFFSLVISFSYGIWFTVLYVFVSMLIPKLIAGGEVDSSTILYLVFFVIMNLISITFKPVGIAKIGLVVSIIDFIIIVALGAAIKPEKIITGLVIVGINIFLFANLGEPLLNLINRRLI